MSLPHLCGVNTSGIVSTCMQDDHRVLRSLGQVLQHSINVEATLLSVPVAVSAQVGEAGKLEDQAVVTCQ